MTDLRIEVLGPLVASRDGIAVPLGGPSPRALVAALVIAESRMVPTGDLVDAIWEGSPPASAEATLQTSVARLRRVLEPERSGSAFRVLVRQGPGYALRADSVDALEFTALAREGGQLLAGGDAVAALDRLERALALWRGPAYADCAHLNFVTPEIIRLEELRTTVREDRMAALLAVGRHSNAVSELESFAREHPLRERAWELLALAQYQGGRQGDALATLREIRDRLAGELGVDPGPALVELERAVLAQDDALNAPVAVLPVPAGERTAEDLVPRTAPVVVPAAPRRSLPGTLTSFVGRTREVEQLTTLVGEHRLVSILGPGGAGKTRLAVETSRTVIADDGPWFVDLSSVHEPALVPDVVAETLGISALGISARGSVDGLVAALRTRRTLLVLDNCEQLRDAVADLVEAVVAGAEDVRMLVTSREPLGLPGEVTFDLPPLDAAAAVSLFRDRARTVAPGWEPDEAERAVLDRICTELDGMPLAIELASAQFRLLSVDEIAEHLDDRFDLLEATGRTTNPRHRSLEAAVDWSWATLDPGAQDLFKALAVFEGGFDLDAAAAVTNPDGPARSTLRGLSALVSKSLLRVESGSGNRRFRMLETLRQYGVAQQSAEQRSAVRFAHLEWAARLAATARAELRGPRSGFWLRRLEVEMPNMRRALRTGLEDGAGVRALELAADLSWFWYRRGLVEEGIRWLDEAIAAADAPSPDVWGRALVGLGLLRYLAGDVVGVAGLAEEVRDRARDADVDPATTAIATSYASIGFLLRGDVPAALDCSAEGLELARACREPWPTADALMSRGQLLRLVGSGPEALAVLDEAVAVADRCGHDWGTTSATWIRAKLLLDLGAPARAARDLRDVCLSLDTAGDVTSWLVCLHTLTGALAVLGKPEQAARLLGACDGIAERAGFSPAAMDPLDTPKTLARVHGSLDAEALPGLLERGRSLRRAAVATELAGLELPPPEPAAPSV